MSKSKSKNKFVALGSSIERKGINRQERETTEEKPLMLFSFKDFQYNSQIPPGQSYGKWQELELLAYMLDKFGHICNVNRIEAEHQKYMKVYGAFPFNSKFKNPFTDDMELQWGVIMRIHGQKGRVAGYVVGNVFYVVFLDSEHKFYPTEKKNT